MICSRSLACAIWGSDDYVGNLDFILRPVDLHHESLGNVMGVQLRMIAFVCNVRV